jgi:hypothetical protein
VADPKADALGERFAMQWLDMEELGTEKRPDSTKFPEFDAALNSAMRAEVTTFFNYIIRKDRPLLELIDSDYTFVNAAPRADLWDRRRDRPADASGETLESARAVELSAWRQCIPRLRIRCGRVRCCAGVG